MTDDELSAALDLEIRNSVGYYGGKLAEQRRKATAYYLARPEGDLAPPEVTGRSDVVVPFVRNTIEAMLPQLMVKFTGGDSVVEFEAAKPGDEQKAQNCTDYLNYLFWKANNGHRIAETWMRDALLYKNGILKIWWDTRQEEKKEEYRGLTPVELAEIVEDKEVEITGQRSYPDEEIAKAREQALQQAQAALQNPQTAQQAQAAIQQLESLPPALLYDVEAIRRPSGGRICIENVPPEEFLINRTAKSIESARFVGHRFERTLSELRSMGYPKSKLANLQSDESISSLNMERIERNSYDDEFAATGDMDTAPDDSQRKYWTIEAYAKIDADGDGIAELRKVTKVGSTILDNEEVDIAPFADIVCIRQPHKFFGLSVMDLGHETQKTKTSILRSSLDNMHLQVNGRYFAVEGQVNLDDLLTNRPGGVVRIKVPGAVGRLDQGVGDSDAGMAMLEYMEGFGEESTGWTRSTQGNDASALTQSTATAANIVTERDDMRIDLIARNFAEGFVELFRQMLRLVCQYQDKKQSINISGEWVDIDPREWRNQFDVNIRVGLGLGGRVQQVQQLTAVIQQQEKVMVLGVANAENIYNASADLAKLIGEKNPDRYFSDPTKNPPPPQQPNPEVIKGQVALQIEQAKGQIALQQKQIDAQVQVAIAQKKAELDAQVALAQQNAQQMQNAAESRNEAALAQFKAQKDAELEAQRIASDERLKIAQFGHEASEGDKDRANKVLIAQIQAQTQLATAAQSAETTTAEGDKDRSTQVELAKQQAELGADKQAAKDAGMAEIKSSLKEIGDHLNTPAEVVRDEGGKAIAIKKGKTVRAIKRDDDGRVTGV